MSHYSLLIHRLNFLDFLLLYLPKFHLRINYKQKNYVNVNVNSGEVAKDTVSFQGDGVNFTEINQESFSLLTKRKSGLQ